jgi:hypothetical protein
VGLALFTAAGSSAAPRNDIGALAVALGRCADGASVDARDIRWAPSRGAIDDAVFGRWAVFLARSPGQDTRDVWRARVRVSPEGRAIGVGAAHDLTNTPLGDDHELVVQGTSAAFATRAYDQEQGITVLDLSGEGAQNKAVTLADRLMAALTNVQQTGAPEGVGRTEVALEFPAHAVGLELGDGALDMALFAGDVRSAIRMNKAHLDLAKSEIAPAIDGVHVDTWIHLPKRFSHWVVDTARAVPWIGPVPIAWLEDRALAARDAYRRATFDRGGRATDVVVTADPPPPVLDTSRESLEEAHWPPPRVPTIWKSPEAGEGEWVDPGVPWLRAVPHLSSDAPPPFLRTFVRPDEDRPYSKVILVAMDLRQLDLDMEAGVEDPEPLTGPPGAGRIPRDPATYRRVAAAFNGAFKTEHGHYGMMVHRRVLLPPIPGSATIIVLTDGRVGFGTWGAERKVGGVLGVADEDVVSFRQNLDPLIDHGRINPTGRNLWGFTLPGKGAQTERSGMCVTTSGHLLYAWGDDVSATALAKAMEMGGCDYAMHLDMNPYHTGFLFTAIDDLPGKKYKSQLLTPLMSIPVDRYIQYAPKDFFYLMVHDPAPPSVDAGTPWAPDGGLQPPPHWMPGLWSGRVGLPQGPIELLDIEPGRASWRIRAGTKDAPAAAPLRELAGEEAGHVLLALGLGVSAEKRALGLATNGRLAVTIREGSDLGMLYVGEDGQLAILRADEAPALGPRNDLAELPIVLWDGRPASGSSGPTVPRAAIGIAPSGRVVVARGTVSGGAPLAEALSRAGCTRGLLLDRGLEATAFLDRAGTSTAPRARYEQSVLYAIGTPLRPRGFRFEASTLFAQSAHAK